LPLPPAGLLRGFCTLKWAAAGEARAFIRSALNRRLAFFFTTLRAWLIAGHRHSY